MVCKWQENWIQRVLGQLVLSRKLILWTRVQPEDYEEPRKGYVPEDPNLRIEGEGEPFLPEVMIPKDDKDFR